MNHPRPCVAGTPGVCGIAGFRNDLDRYVPHLDMLVLPSHTEGLPNVVLAPHIGSASSDTRVKMSTLAVENCLAVLEGKPPLTPVNPEALSAPRR